MVFWLLPVFCKFFMSVLVSCHYFFQFVVQCGRLSWPRQLSSAPKILHIVLYIVSYHYFGPRRGVKHCNNYVSESNCLTACISQKPHGRIYHIFAARDCSHDLVLCCNTLCVYGFANDVMFSHNRRYARTCAFLSSETIAQQLKLPHQFNQILLTKCSSWVEQSLNQSKNFRVVQVE